MVVVKAPVQAQVPAQQPWARPLDNRSARQWSSTHLHLRLLQLTSTHLQDTFEVRQYLKVVTSHDSWHHTILETFLELEFLFYKHTQLLIITIYPHPLNFLVSCIATISCWMRRIDLWDFLARGSVFCPAQIWGADESWHWRLNQHNVNVTLFPRMDK